MRNSIYGHCLQFTKQHHISSKVTHPAPRPALQLRPRTKYDTACVSTVPERHFVGLTQVNRQIRREFLTWYRNDLEVNVRLTDVPNYIRTFLPMDAPGHVLAAFTGTIFVEVVNSDRQWIDLRPLLLLLKSAPKATIPVWKHYHKLSMPIHKVIARILHHFVDEIDGGSSSISAQNTLTRVTCLKDVYTIRLFICTTFETADLTFMFMLHPRLIDDKAHDKLDLYKWVRATHARLGREFNKLIQSAAVLCLLRNRYSDINAHYYVGFRLEDGRIWTV